MPPFPVPTIDLAIPTTYFTVGSVAEALWPNLTVHIQADKQQVLDQFTPAQLWYYLQQSQSGWLVHKVGVYMQEAIDGK